MRGKILAGLGVLFAGVTYAQVLENKTDKNLPIGAVQFLAKEIVWTDAPSTLPKGSKIAVLEGSPKLAGMFTMRVELPPNSEIPPHRHPREERVTVLSGILYLGFGEKQDTTNRARFTVGSFYINPPETSHFVWTERMPVVLQITGMGPWEIHFIEDKKE